MSKRKNRDRRAPSDPPDEDLVREPKPADSDPNELPPPDPPQPNLPFLIVTSTLCAIWIGFLLYMAVQTLL